MVVSGDGVRGLGEKAKRLLLITAIFFWFDFLRTPPEYELLKGTNDVFLF